MAGAYLLRGSAPRGWIMKSVYLDGRDVTDQPVDVKSENITGLNVIFSDKVSGVAGNVRDARGNPVGESRSSCSPPTSDSGCRSRVTSRWREPTPPEATRSPAFPRATI